MASENETIADIIAEMRALSNPISDGIIAINGRSIADRFDAAHKRERGDCAKLREALCEILSYIESFHKYIIPEKREKTTALFAVADTIRNNARAALAAPARECDVGTPAEQAQRMADFCKRHYKKAVPGRHICSACKFHNKDVEWECYFAWAQMPYESEAGK